MARGFVYLVAVMDWFSRRVLAWRVSSTLEVEFCVDALEEALARHGRPEIFNTDQGASSPARTSPALLLETAIAISMDGRGPGATTFSSSGSGARSNTRRSTCTPMTTSLRRAPRSAATSASTTASGRIRAWTHARPTKPTSMACRWSRQHEFRRRWWASLRSGYALPARRPPTAIHVNNRQNIHLSEAKRCSDEPGHSVHRSNLMLKMKAASLPELARMADKLDLAREKPQSPMSERSHQLSCFGMCCRVHGINALSGSRPRAVNQRN